MTENIYKYYFLLKEESSNKVKTLKENFIQ